MAEGLGEVVLGIRVDADQAAAGLNAFRAKAEQAGQAASRALSIRPKSKNPDFAFAQPAPPLPSGYGKAIEDAAKGLQGVEGAASGAAGAVGGLRAAFAGLAPIFATISAVDIGRRIAEAGLNAESAQVRLRALTRGFNEFGPAQDVAANASKTLGISLTEAQNGISSLYASLRPAGVGLKDIETIFISFTAAARNSGSTAEEASNAFIQLKQSLSKGFLNGDELRSIGEQAPIVAQAIAETLGVSVGKLRDLGAEGKITSEVILTSLERIKGAQLAQLGEQLDTGRQKLKDFQIAATELGKDISGILAPIGNTLLGGLTGSLEFLSGLNADPVEEEIKKVEGQIKSTKSLIEEQTEFGIDTSEAETRVTELEIRLNKLKSNKSGGDRVASTQDQIKELQKIRKRNEELNRSGPFNSVGDAEFAVTAQIEGLKKAERLFKVIDGQSAPSFDISKEVSALGFQLKTAEDDIAEFSRQKLSIPIEAIVEQAALDQAIKEAQNKAKDAEIRIGLRLQFEELGKEQARLQKLVQVAPDDSKLKVRLKEVEVSRARNLSILQASGNAADKVASAAGKEAAGAKKAAAVYVDSISSLQEGLKQASENQIKVGIDTEEFNAATQDIAFLEARTREIDGQKATITAEFILEGIKQGTITNSIANVRTAVENLNNAQVSVDVDSTQFEQLGRRVVEEEQKLQEFESKQRVVRIKALIEGLDSGDYENSVQNATRLIQDLDAQAASVDVDSPTLRETIQGLVEARQRLDEIDGKKATVEVELIEKNINNGKATNNISNLDRRISAAQQAQRTAEINSPEFQQASRLLSELNRKRQDATRDFGAERRQALQQSIQNTLQTINKEQQAAEQLRQKYAELAKQKVAANQAIEAKSSELRSIRSTQGGVINEEQARDKWVGVVDSIRDALAQGADRLASATAGAFQFLNKSEKSRVLSEARTTINEGTQFGIDRKFAESRDPNVVLAAAAASKQLQSAYIEEAAQRQKLTEASRIAAITYQNELQAYRNRFKSGDLFLQKSSEMFAEKSRNPPATIKTVAGASADITDRARPIEAELENLRKTTANLSESLNVAGKELANIVMSQQTNTGALSKLTSAVGQLTAKNWAVQVNVNASNGASTVSTLSNLA